MKSESGFSSAMANQPFELNIILKESTLMRLWEMLVGKQSGCIRHSIHCVPALKSTFLFLKKNVVTLDIGCPVLKVLTQSLFNGLVKVDIAVKSARGKIQAILDIAEPPCFSSSALPSRGMNNIYFKNICSSQGGIYSKSWTQKDSMQYWSRDDIRCCYTRSHPTCIIFPSWHFFDIFDLATD